MSLSGPPTPATNGSRPAADPLVEPIEEPRFPEIPPILPGTPDRSRPASPNPFSVEAPGVDPGPGLAFVLNWEIQRHRCR